MCYIDTFLDQANVCAILYNMIVELGRDGRLSMDSGQAVEEVQSGNVLSTDGGATRLASSNTEAAVDDYVARRGALISETAHRELQVALIDHLLVATD